MFLLDSRMKISYLLFAFILLSCLQKEPERQHSNNFSQKANESSPTAKQYMDYESFLDSVRIKRNRIKNYKAANRYFFDLMSDDISHYWYGTSWDFDGITEVPKTGSIACGYFVTTTLKQLGFKVQRYKLAQQAAAVIAKTLCTDVQTVEGYTGLKEKLGGVPDSSVLILGLDFHVGFLLKESDDKIYFLHSNYINRIGVVKESIDTSGALQNSKLYVVGSISDNERFIRQWINQ